MSKKRMPLLLLIVLGLGMMAAVQADERTRGREAAGKAGPRLAAIEDYAYNYLEINKLGFHATNGGQFYPRGGEQGPTFEYPTGSGREVMYRMNMYAGIPGNMVTSRAYSVKEWDPQPGYHNPAVGLLAVSNDETTWPIVNSEPWWPMRRADGSPYIVASQQSFGVYNDDTNYLATQDPPDPSKKLNVEVQQSSFAWNTAEDEDYIIFQFDVINRNTSGMLEDFYWGIYYDGDAGGFSSATEWQDDLADYDLDRNFTWIYDSDGVTDQAGWVGDPFPIGLVFLDTPEATDGRSGITDWRYSATVLEPIGGEEDSLQYWLVTGDPRLNATDYGDTLLWGDDPHYDEKPIERNPNGRPMALWASTGPFDFAAGDTLSFVIATVAGDDMDDINANVDRVRQVYADGYESVKVVPQPQVKADIGDGEIILQWSNEIDTSYYDPISQRNNLAGYRIYRTDDPQRVDWTMIEEVPVGEYEIEHDGPTTSATDTTWYTFTDRAVLNGFYYSYSVTAFDSTGGESGIAGLGEDVNTVELRPTVAPVAAGQVEQIRVVPNPFVVSASWERERLGNQTGGEPIRELAFQNVPSPCTIRIYTLDADHVATIEHRSPEGTVYWDLRSDANMLVTSGVYFFHVEAHGNEYIGKFAVIR